MNKVESPITNFIVYGLETYNKVRAVPYCSCIYKLSKVSGEYHQDITEKGYQKDLNDCVVFKESGCINQKLDHVLSFKEKLKMSKMKIVEIIIFLIAHNGSGSDNYIVLNTLPQWRTVPNLRKTELVLFRLKFLMDM